MTIKQIILMACIPAILSPVFACDMHGAGGYGFSPFGPRYSMADRYETSSQPSAEAQLSITHDRFLSVANGTPSVLLISYEVPNSFIDVKLSFSSDKDIDLLEEPEIILTKSSGVYKLHFASQQIGDQHIKVHISALGEATSVEEERHITVRSI